MINSCIHSYINHSFSIKQSQTKYKSTYLCPFNDKLTNYKQCMLKLINELAIYTNIDVSFTTNTGFKNYLPHYTDSYILVQ